MDENNLIFLELVCAHKYAEPVKHNNQLNYMYHWTIAYLVLSTLKPFAIWWVFPFTVIAAKSVLEKKGIICAYPISLTFMRGSHQVLMD